jgi:catechol 2,3-dioxygenase-like lactoylglutathione lyase family enzyme
MEENMRLHGGSHIGLSTLDLDATRSFYEDVLEYAAQTRTPADPHVSAGRRFTASLRGPSRITDFRDS